MDIPYVRVMDVMCTLLVRKQVVLVLLPLSYNNFSELFGISPGLQPVKGWALRAAGVLY